jgi:hypothetical protein
MIMIRNRPQPFWPVLFRGVLCHTPEQLEAVKRHGVPLLRDNAGTYKHPDKNNKCEKKDLIKPVV